MLDLEFRFKVSKCYLGLLLSLLWLSTIIVAWLPAATWIKGLCFLFIAAYGGYMLWSCALLLSPQSITTLRRHSNGLWSVTMRGVMDTGELSGSSLVTPLVSLLRFRLSKRYWLVSCVVFSDALPSDQYRQLVVALNMG